MTRGEPRAPWPLPLWCLIVGCWRLLLGPSQDQANSTNSMYQAFSYASYGNLIVVVDSSSPMSPGPVRYAGLPLRAAEPPPG